MNRPTLMHEEPKLQPGGWSPFAALVAPRKAVPADVKDQPPLLDKPEIVYPIPPLASSGDFEINENEARFSAERIWIPKQQKQPAKTTFLLDAQLRGILESAGSYPP